MMSLFMKHDLVIFKGKIPKKYVQMDQYFLKLHEKTTKFDQYVYKRTTIDYVNVTIVLVSMGVSRKTTCHFWKCH